MHESKSTPIDVNDTYSKMPMMVLFVKFRLIKIKINLLS